MELTRKKIYLLISIFVIVLILLTIFVIVPLITDIYSLADQIKKQKIKLATFELEEKNLKQLKNQQKEIDQDLQSLSQSLVSTRDSLSFILPIENVASRTNVKQTINILNKTIDSSSTKKNEGEENNKQEKISYALEEIPYLSASIKLQGDFKNSLNYLLQLENMGIYSDITDFTMRAKTSTSSSNPTVEEPSTPDLLNTTLQLRAFTSE